MVRLNDKANIDSVGAALELSNVEGLIQLRDLLPTTLKPTRKAELIALIEQHFVDECLRALWDRLDDVQQLAVAETIYCLDGVFNADRSKYGQRKWTKFMWAPTRSLCASLLSTIVCISPWPNEQEVYS